MWNSSIDVLSGLQVVICSMKCVNLNNETLEILGVHFSYNKNLEQDKKFSEQIVKIENILNLWRMIQLTLKGRIKLFKSSAISKVIHLLLITKFHYTVKAINSAPLRLLKRIVRHIWDWKFCPLFKGCPLFGVSAIGSFHCNTIDIMYKISKSFIWQGKKIKTKHSTLCNGYEKGDLENFELRNKITSIRCSWVKRLFKDDFHDWKIMALFLIRKHSGKNFKFQNNIDISKDILSKFPYF